MRMLIRMSMIVYERLGLTHKKSYLYEKHRGNMGLFLARVVT